MIIGARADGTKELLALELGYRESTESWATVLGLWAALRTVYRSTRHQRCWIAR